MNQPSTSAGSVRASAGHLFIDQRLGFVLRALVLSIVLFGLIRTDIVSRNVVLPLTMAQGAVARWLVGDADASAVAVTLDCSGTDVVALLISFVLAFPTTVQRRIAGAVTGASLLLGLNTLRIANLIQVAHDPWWLNTLHVHIWPALLTLVVVAWTLRWMDRSTTPTRPPTIDATAAAGSVAWDSWPVLHSRRFVAVLVVSVIVFVAMAPLYLRSASLLRVATMVANSASHLMTASGLETTCRDNLLVTSRGSFLVTQECVATPILPLFFAAAVCVPSTWRRRLWCLVLGGPLFFSLAVARLLVLALPAAVVASPSLAIHAFNQVVLGLALVVGATMWRRQSAAATPLIRHALVATGGVIVASMITGPALTRGIFSVATDLGTRLGLPTAAVGGELDPQASLALLPVFQFGLFVALWSVYRPAFSWRTCAMGLGLLAIAQLVLMVVLGVLSASFGLIPHPRDLRAWAIVAPLLVLVLLVQPGKSSDSLEPSNP